MTALPITNPEVKKFTDFIKARERHRRAKAQGNWTSLGRPDPIITQYRFCNVRRNDDRVTKYILSWLKQFPEGTEWFAAVVARLFNNEDTLEDIAPFVSPFKPTQMRNTLRSRKANGAKNFNAAYIVSTNGRRMDKVDYLIEHVLTPLWSKRAALGKAISGATLAEAHELLLRQDGLGSFMAAQVLADIKYLTPFAWSDFDTFAASGPGSKRGLNRVLRRDKEHPMPEAVFRATLAALRERVNATLRWGPPITAQDLQNCLCEYDKYQRAATGEGTPKQIYKPLTKG